MSEATAPPGLTLKNVDFNIYSEMKRYYSSLLAVFAGLSLFSCGGPQEKTNSSESDTYPKAKGVTRIAHYNVGVFSKEIDNSIPMVAAMMKEIGADALSLNELDSCNTRHENYQLADLAKEMGGWNYWFSRAMPYREGAYGVGIAVPNEIIDSFTIPLAKGDGSEPRACSVVETKYYVIASTHLDHRAESSVLDQAQTINDVLAKKYAKSRKPVFLCGDMNSRPESETLKVLKKEWDVLSVEKFTIPPKEPRACIDFILALRNKAKFKLIGSDVPTVFKNGDVTIASDHLPVYVDVKL